MLMCVCATLCFRQIFPQKDLIFRGLLLKPLEIYRTEDFLNLLEQVALLIGGAPGCLQDIVQCA